MTIINITKRSGIKSAFDPSKINLVIDYACKDLEVDSSKLRESVSDFLYEDIETSRIQELLIQRCVTFISVQEPDWRIVAGRLTLLNLYKSSKEVNGHSNFGYPSYLGFLKKATELGVYSREILDNYSEFEIESFEKNLNYGYDLTYDYGRLLALQKRYLIKVDKKTFELPQFLYASVALMTAMKQPKATRLKKATEYYQSYADRKISAATPINLNLRTPTTSLASCFIQSIDDDLESIYGALTNAALISKNAGGLGNSFSKVRAHRSWIGGDPDVSGGVIPWIKSFNDTAVSVNQRGKRAGAFTVALDVWHLDIEDFLELQTENGDQRGKAYDVLPQVVVNNEFLRRYKDKEPWYLFDPYEIRTKYNTELADLYGEQFLEFYTHIVEEAEAGNIKLFKKVDPSEIMKLILKAVVEVGTPYWFNKDTVNATSQNKHVGTVYCGNLCVAPETKILTKYGYEEIQYLAGEELELWNGEEWSLSKVFQTGENQELITVSLSDGSTVDCTKYHGFPVINNLRTGDFSKVEAQNLNIGDKLIKFDLPVIDGELDFPYDYTHGFYTGDGNLDQSGPLIKLYGAKKALIDKFTIRNKIWSCGSKTVIKEGLAIYEELDLDRITIKLPLDMPSKFIVPDCKYSVKSRLRWLSGLMDSDGTLLNSSNSQSVQISSTNKEFLNEVRLMLQTLGCTSKISDLFTEKYFLMPDGKGSKKEYLCKPAYRLLINGNSLFKLHSLGLETFRLNINLEKPNLENTRYVSVVSINNSGRISDTYCFTEPKRHIGMFNGIALFQCQESFTPFKASGKPNHLVEDDREVVFKDLGLIHTCNLCSIVLPEIKDDDDLRTQVRRGIEILDNLLGVGDPPVAEAQRHNDQLRILGLGVMGYHEYCTNHGIRYSESAEFADKLFEKISYWAIEKSAELAKERGQYPMYEGSEWSKGIFFGRHYSDIPNRQGLDWNVLGEKVKSYGMRNGGLLAIAPNTSTSILIGCSASILPVYDVFFNDENSLGTFPVMPSNVNNVKAFWLYETFKDIDQKKIIDVCSSAQKWIDQGISMELCLNLNKMKKATDVLDLYLYAMEKGCKTVYYLRTQKKVTEACSVCAN